MKTRLGIATLFVVAFIIGQTTTPQPAAAKGYSVELCLSYPESTLIVVQLSDGTYWKDFSNQEGCVQFSVSDPTVKIEFVEVNGKVIDNDSIATDGKGRLPDSDASGGIRRVTVNQRGEMIPLSQPIEPKIVPDPVPPLRQINNNEPPICSAIANPVTGNAPLSVELNADGSYDPDGGIQVYDWSWAPDGFASGHTIVPVFDTPGIKILTLTVYDNEGLWSDCKIIVNVTEPLSVATDGQQPKETPTTSVMPTPRVATDGQQPKQDSTLLVSIWVALAAAFIAAGLTWAWMSEKLKKVESERNDMSKHAEALMLELAEQKGMTKAYSNALAQVTHKPITIELVQSIKEEQDVPKNI